jgi:hypothetical protein
MAKGNEANEVTERLARTTFDSYQAFVNHAVGLQESNVRYAQGLVEDSIRGLRRQSEKNLEMAHELFERVEEHGDAVQRLAEESVDAYVNLLYLPFSYYTEGLKAANQAPTG